MKKLTSLAVSIIMLLSLIPVSFAGDNYIATNGIIGSSSIFGPTYIINNTKTYFFVAKTTDSIKITCLSAGTWSTLSGNPENVTFTYDIWLASGERPIDGMNNPLVNVYRYSWVHTVNTNVVSSKLDGIGCTTNAIIPQNSWVAVGFSVSSPIVQNGTQSFFPSYTVLGTSPTVISRLNEDQPGTNSSKTFYFQAPWVLYQGATYEDTTPAPSYNLYNFDDMFLSFATQYGVGKDALEIGFSGFIMLALFAYFRNRDIEITAKIFTLIAMLVVTGFYFIGISPLYYTLIVDVFGITLLIGSAAKTVVNGNSEV